jgi:putative YhbY family RNA-binding protein
MPLKPSRRSELRAQAHGLSPVVIIGDKGLTDEVVAEIDRSLKAHELIKVRAATDDRDARDQWLKAICEKAGAEPVQQIGKVFVLFRENPKEPARTARERPPQAKREPRGKPTVRKSRVAQAASETKRTARPRSRTPSAPPESLPPRRRPRSSR